MNNQDSIRLSFSPWPDEHPSFQTTTLFFTHNPMYSTVPVRGKNNKINKQPPYAVIKSVVNSPYRRINRVNRMIMSHRHEVSQSKTGQMWKTNTNLLKPQFKIKSLKHVTKKGNFIPQSSKGCMVHVRNFTLDNFSISRRLEDIDERHGINGFQDNFKNRQKLHKKANKTTKDASLIDRLNKITQKAPLNRYKSRAVGLSTRVVPFTGNF